MIFLDASHFFHWWFISAGASSVDNFGMRITDIVANLFMTLGEIVDDARIVKYLCVMPAHLNLVAMSTEMFYDIKMVTVEELMWRLWVAADCLDEKVDQIIDRLVGCCSARTGLRNKIIVSKPVRTRRAVFGSLEFSSCWKHDLQAGKPKSEQQSLKFSSCWNLGCCVYNSHDLMPLLFWGMKLELISLLVCIPNIK